MPIDCPFSWGQICDFFLEVFFFACFFSTKDTRPQCSWFKERKSCFFVVGFLLVQDPSVFSDRCVSFAGALCTNRNSVQVHPTCLHIWRETGQDLFANNMMMGWCISCLISQICRFPSGNTISHELISPCLMLDITRALSCENRGRMVVPACPPITGTSAKWQLSPG